MPIQFFRPGPPFWSAKDDHWPTRTLRRACEASVLLNAANLLNAALQRGRHRLMHDHRFMAFDHVRIPAVASKQLFQFLCRNPRQDRGVRDLVSVEVENRQYGSVMNRVQEFVRVPGRSNVPAGTARVRCQSGDRSFRKWTTILISASCESITLYAISRKYKRSSA